MSSANSSRVVIAEDEALIRLDLRETLVEEGYEVVGEASDGDEALALVRELRPDVVILDIKMPGTDGLVAAREIMAERLAAVVILTAFSQRELIQQASDAGALAYVVKPFERNDLVPAIELSTARFRELVALAHQAEAESERADATEKKLEVRKTIDRAKGKLMDEHGMSEAEAFRYLQTEAMGRRGTMEQVSAEILSGELSP